MAGNFSQTSQNIYLIDGRILEAECVNEYGEWVRSSLDLDSCIGNLNGWLAWDGCGFAETAVNVALVEGGTKLEACLIRADGSESEYQGIYLNERIANDNGRLVFLCSTGFQGSGLQGVGFPEDVVVEEDIGFRGAIDYEEDRIAQDVGVVRGVIDYEEDKVRGEIDYEENRVRQDFEGIRGAVDYEEDRVRNDIQYEEDRFRNDVEYGEERVLGGVEFREDIRFREDIGLQEEVVIY